MFGCIKIGVLLDKTFRKFPGEKRDIGSQKKGSLRALGKALMETVTAGTKGQR